MGWFGQPGHTCEKKVWGRLWATFEARFFMFSWAKKILIFFWKNFSVCTEKLHRIRVKNVRKHFGMYFYRGKTSFFRAKNFNLSTKTLWSVLCWLLLWAPNTHDRLYNFRVSPKGYFVLIRFVIWIDFIVIIPKDTIEVTITTITG